ncbi:hypothetical protein A2U01_0001298 [Trifolium medium]|uniref:Uncharacterized protein n=1 Tax=Trifolium medium TaxID=97028 RepID=A0A392LZX0_9FABA|nr:hypothetical protein [Trifolium medium]
MDKRFELIASTGFCKNSGKGMEGILGRVGIRPYRSIGDYDLTYKDSVQVSLFATLVVGCMVPKTQL